MAGGICKAIVIIAVLLSIVIGGICFLRREPASRQEVYLPGAGGVKAMTAVIFDNRKRMGIPPVPAFQISPRYIPVILSAISPAERFDYPAECDNLWARGEIDITTTDMQRFEIRFCDGGENPLYFTVNGIRCMRGGAFRPTLVNQKGEGEKWSDESSLVYQILRDIQAGSEW